MMIIDKKVIPLSQYVDSISQEWFDKMISMPQKYVYGVEIDAPHGRKRISINGSIYDAIAFAKRNEKHREKTGLIGFSKRRHSGNWVADARCDYEALTELGKKEVLFSPLSDSVRIFIRRRKQSRVN